ncbi:MAG: glycosyltransferase [Pseudomonadota bacterium]
MARFARERTVVYVEPPVYLNALRRDLAKGQVREKGLYFGQSRNIQDRLYALSTGALSPVSLRGHVGQASWWHWSSTLKRKLRELGVREYIAWLSKPSWYPAIGRIQSSQLVYHVVDEYSGYSGLTPQRREEIRQLERKVLSLADTVIVVSRPLLESKRALNPNVHLVPNGVDTDAYLESIGDARVPSDIAELGRPVIGYSGLIASRLDLVLLDRLAKERPSYSLVLVGAVRDRGCETELDTLRSNPNVRFLGLKESREVPAYMKAIDVGIIPYVLNERAVNADPLKLYEYSAAGKITVATRFSEPRSDLPFFLQAGSHNEFIHMVDKAVTLSGDTDVVARAMDFADRNSWNDRVKSIQLLLHG